MSIIYVQKSGAKICLPIDMNTKIIFVLTISLFVKIVFYFVFPDHIRTYIWCLVHLSSMRVYHNNEVMFSLVMSLL